MVCSEDVVSYFRSLKSYERIWIMCRLQHCCLPFELRFLGTCLEELGKKDFHELRQVENEANSTAEINFSELRKISDKNVQKKIILYLSLLYSYNYSCSNSLFKILYNQDEINAILNYETCEDEDVFEYLLMMYTLAVNHPAFSFEQRQALLNIFTIIQVEEGKRFKRKLNQLTVDPAESGPYNNTPIQIQECQPPISTSPENVYHNPHALPNPSHCFSTVPSPYHGDLPIPMAEQISIGLPTTSFVRYPFQTATSPHLLPCGWNTAVPLVFTSTDQTNTTHTFISRSSSPSISNSASRSSSPSTKGRPVSVPFTASSHMAGPLPQPTTVSLPQAGIDSFTESNSKESLIPINTAQNFSPDQLYRLTDEGLAAIGMTEESIQQLRCLADKMQNSTNGSSPTHSTNETLHYVDSETEKIKTFIEQSVPTTGLLYTASMAIPSNPVGNSVPCTPSNLCQYCLSGQNNNQMNGFPTTNTADISSCLDHMRVLRLESDAPSHNSNSSNSGSTSSEQSPPNTPVLTQSNFNKRTTINHSDNEWNNNNTNKHETNNKNLINKNQYNLNNNNSNSISNNNNSNNNNNNNNNNNSNSNNNNNNNNNNCNNNNNNNKNNNNNHNDERNNAGDSSSEERNPVQPIVSSGRGRIISNRGRSRSSNSYSRGRGNNRRRAENVNGNSEDSRKTQYSVSNQEGTAFQFNTNPGTATVTNTTYIQPSHFIRSYPSFPANNFLRPTTYPFPPSGEVLYQYPPPGTYLSHGPIPYPPVVPPKVCCYNCGRQDHFAHDCPESTMEEASKQGQYRLDYTTTVEGAFTEK